ncbi:MAG TPA: helix-turn-helix domain-containing protein [Candidatus Cloacimonadota bacterium]|jgi:excisionase family DNA binding protein|nr:helix-turn-helix domain-containing protein [Candidatus Cloacimonadota bacterium]HPS38586.1 helix-turn-helix domain-containing protein [Candidatus Cloacimonadota bacterium]
MEDRLLSVEDLRLYLGVNRDTVYKWVNEKGLPALKIGRLWKFRKADVDEWVKQFTHKKPVAAKKK